MGDVLVVVERHDWSKPKMEKLLSRLSGQVPRLQLLGMRRLSLKAGPSPFMSRVVSVGTNLLKPSEQQANNKRHKVVFA